MAVDLLEMRGIAKHFGGALALDGVDFSLAAGEVHALVGENGAGKSTLMKILSGTQKPDAGTISLEGRTVSFHGVSDAQRRGVVMVYQELELVPDLSIAENLFLGRLPSFVRSSSLRTAAQDFLRRVGLDKDPMLSVRRLGVGEQQLVVIARALVGEARILILDEPTAALSAQETERLFGIVRSIREQGVGVIYISHRLEEIFAIADRVTVLRDGRRIATEAVSGTSPAQIVQQMVGRHVESYQREHHEGGEILARFRVGRSGVQPLDLVLHEGEIVGLAGVIGSGRSEVVAALFGNGREAHAHLDDQPITGPRDAIGQGLSLVPADRKTQGLVLVLSVSANLNLAILERLSRWGVLRRPQEATAAQAQIRRLGIRPPNPGMIARQLSGGNQQKVVVGKALATEPRVLLLDEPTRGVDIGARNELYEVIEGLARNGLGLVVSSSDTEELSALCDRILVFHGGRVTAELSAPFSSREVVEHVTGAN